MNRRTFLKEIASSALAATASYSLLSSTAMAADYSPPLGVDRPRVLLIGLDGTRPDALQVARTPNIDDLIKNGAFSYHAKAGQHTWSGPGWSNILTGVWEEKHGVIDNSFTHPHYQCYPSVFTRLERLHPELYTAAVVSWKPLKDYLIPHADQCIVHIEDDHQVMNDAISLLTDEDPDLMFVYFGNVDLVGHKYGFHPNVTPYRKEIEHVDREIGSVLEALRGRKQYAHENWLILCTTDHGGTMEGHGKNIPEDRTIFYIVSGDSVPRGRISATPYQVDVVPTILKHLRIPVDPPGDWMEKCVEFKNY